VTSLTNRIFVACALLAVVSLAVALFMVNGIITRQAEDALRRDLEDAAMLVGEYRASLVQQLTQQARLIADLPKLKAAVEADHAPTLAPIAHDYQREIAADLFVVSNRSGRALSWLDTGGRPAGPSPLDAAIALAREHQESTLVWPDAGRLLQVVTVPIWIDPEAPEILGALSIGVSLDGAFARRFKTLTTSDLAFRDETRIWLGTLPPSAEARLLAIAPTSTAFRLELDDEEFGGRIAPLAPIAPTREAGAAGSPPVEPAALVLRSRTARLSLLEPLRLALGLTAMLALLVATLVSYGLARTITRPLGALTAAMRETALTGDIRTIATPLVAGRRADADARLLISAFNAMTGSIAAFQHEASQRERLSSLGRLSTVLAHEIRNPLMIIKASVRTLRRSLARQEAPHEAVEDIDLEVRRLDRLVDEVLDFARPIRFELGPTDLAAIAESARAAVLAGDPPADIRLTVHAPDTAAITDAERLRQALVNLLDNAEQSSSAPPEPVQIDVDAASDDRFVVRVRDHGHGIAPDQLPRIFEPYFTTRRTGSGIGLAITRNIVEGLGGRITVASEPGRGTEFALELPRDARTAMARTA
jgi:signal transduction histidine kinase